MIFYLNEFTVRSGLSKPEDRPMIDPGMAGNDTVGFTGS
jgi:hypothetical protein